MVLHILYLKIAEKKALKKRFDNSLIVFFTYFIGKFSILDKK